MTVMPWGFTVFQRPAEYKTSTFYLTIWWPAGRFLLTKRLVNRKTEVLGHLDLIPLRPTLEWARFLVSSDELRQHIQQYGDGTLWLDK